MAAVDNALALSSNDSSTTSQPVANTLPTNEAKVSKLHCLLKRRLQLCAAENRIKTAVEELIKKYRTEEQLTDRITAVHGTCDAVTKYSCYAATCITHDASNQSGLCYSVLCRHMQEQAFSCKVCLPEKLQQDLHWLIYTMPSIEDENVADESSVNHNSAVGSSLGSDSKPESTTNNISNNCVHARQEVYEEQSVGSTVSEDRTRFCDTTNGLRLLTGLLQRRVCGGKIYLTEVLVNRLQSLLDTVADTRNPVCLRGTVRKSDRKRAEIPVAHDFRTRSHRQSVFVLTPSTLRHLARIGGMLFTIPGFSSTASTKTDSGWIYVSPRPLFNTAWRYRTASASNLSAIALQLRVLWCCVRWDDLSSDSSPEDVTVASEADMVTTTTILRRRDVGKDGLRSEYLVRRVSGPPAAGDDWHGN